ncbi:MAG: Holliday junction branch migration protein RuvA [Myxococcales bacterium]|nr:Holliday junction branch migration protein RuvA [Myxococcales bacterium]
MIAWLSGHCRQVGSDHVVLDVSGVGYEVFVTASDLASIVQGIPLAVSVHTVVREDALLLYGFVEVASRDLFRLLISVSGVGPKGALALLSTLSPSAIARTIHDGKPGPLTKAKGIGKRTAELLIVKLRDRLPAELLIDMPEPMVAEPKSSSRTPIAQDAISALVNLGYRVQQAETTIDTVLAGDDAPSGDLGALITSGLAALRTDGRGRHGG